MAIPKIHTRATNVELTDTIKSLISRKLNPLARFLVHESDVQIDVVMRGVRSRFGGDVYHVSVKVTTPTNTYISVATERHIAKALTKTRETIRRTISRGASVVDYELRKERQLKDSFTLSLQPH